ncbi:hypothetical protein BDY21DRAFT_333542, partial [Lineolata rhizophorae]
MSAAMMVVPRAFVLAVVVPVAVWVLGAMVVAMALTAVTATTAPVALFYVRLALTLVLLCRKITFEIGEAH